MANQTIDITVFETPDIVNLNITPNLIEINIIQSEGGNNILQFDSLANFPATGSVDFIYLAKDTNRIYRWTGSAYVEISGSASLVWGAITGTLSNQTDLQNALNDKQPLDGDLTSIAALTGTAGFLKKNGANSWNLDDSTYALDSAVVKLAGNQTIAGDKTFTGGVINDGSLYLKQDGSFASKTGYTEIFSGIGQFVNLNFGASIVTQLRFLATSGQTLNFPDASGTVALTSDIPSLSGYVPTSRTLTINGTTFDLSANRSWTIATGSGTVTSVAMTVPSAFSVSGSPITSSGTLAITANGNTTQYIAGDGSLVTFPTIGIAGTLIREVRNTTASTLTKGTVVYISGANGNKPTVSKAIATGDSTSAQTFGLVQADIAANANGNVVCVGDLTGLDTSAFTAGDQLYLSSTTAGTYTTTKQLAPNHLVYIGVVTRSHPTLGQIEVNIQNGYELYELHDVSITSVANNDGLFYEASTDLWKNKSIATVLGYTPANGANYLPLTGGTLTGALSGTSATFSSSVTGNSFIKSGGTSSEFLKADGSIDSSTYLPLAGGTVTGNVNFTSTTTHTGNATFGVGSPTAIDGSDGRIITNKFRLYNTTPATIYSDIITVATSNRTITIPDASGTIALTSNLSAYLPLSGGTLTGALGGTSAAFSSSVTATSFVRTSGTSSQFLKADGSVDSSAYLPLSGGTLTGNLNGTTATFSSTLTATGALTMSAYSFADTAIQFRRATTNTVNPAGGNGIMVFGGGNSQIRIGTANDINFDVNDGGTPYTVLKLQQNSNTVIVNSSNNSLPLGIAFQGTVHGYLGAASSALFAYSNNGGYVTLNSSSVWVIPSDRNRKRNFEQYNLGLNEILELKPFLYNMDFQKDGDEKQVGLIAQEVKDYIPLAYEENDKFIGLNYNAIIVTMVNAIKELKAELDTLKK